MGEWGVPGQSSLSAMLPGGWGRECARNWGALRDEVGLGKRAAHGRMLSEAPGRCGGSPSPSLQVWDEDHFFL